MMDATAKYETLKNVASVLDRYSVYPERDLSFSMKHFVKQGMFKNKREVR
jgi:hypothetical protein